MKRRAFYLIAVLGLAAGHFAACSGESDNGDDGGVCQGAQQCREDNNCTPPETCQPNGCCAYVDPDANRATGTFGLYMNSNRGGSLVNGKLDGKGFFMNLGGQVEFIQEQGIVKMEIYGLVTSNIINSFVFQLPTDPPLDQEIKFGIVGIAKGTYDLIDIDNDGYELSRHSIADVVGGYISFSAFSLSTDQSVDGEIDIQLKSR